MICHRRPLGLSRSIKPCFDAPAQGDCEGIAPLAPTVTEAALEAMLFAGAGIAPGTRRKAEPDWARQRRGCAPEAGTRRHASGLPGLSSKAVVRVCSAMVHRDPFETLRLPQRAIPRPLGPAGSQLPRPPPAAPRVEGHNFDSSNCCRSPIHILARSASSLLAWSVLPRAL